MLTDIGTEHIHALQQRLVECWQLRVFESTFPIISHQLIIRFKGMQSVGVNLMRMDREIVLQFHYSSTKISIIQMRENILQALMSIHSYFFFNHA